MNLHEVWAVLSKDMPKLIWKRDSLFPKATKEMERDGVFPSWKMYEYRLPASQNQYIFYFYADSPYTPVLGGFLFTMFDGPKRYVIKWTEAETPNILVLTSHFLQRYKERYLKQPELTANEVAIRYCSRNGTMMPMPVDERINKRIGQYGEYAGEGFLVQDGFCFKLTGEEQKEGERPVVINFLTTFMPFAKLSQSQMEAIYDEAMKALDE